MRDMLLRLTLSGPNIHLMSCPWSQTRVEMLRQVRQKEELQKKKKAGGRYKGK